MDKPIPIIAIEQKYPVEKIKVNGFYFWPFLKSYIGSQIHFKKNRQVKVGKENIKYLIQSLFFGLPNLFKKADYIFLSSSDQRKFIENKYTDRIDYFIDKIKDKKTLVVEQPNIAHFPINQVKTNIITSKTWLYLVERFTSFSISPKFEEEIIIKDILKEYDLDLNYKKLAQSFLAQYKVSSFFFKQKKIKKLFTTTAYINCARLKAAKDLGAMVIEFQHGIVNKSHHGYNVSKNIDSDFYPDYFLSFGEKEIDVFDDKNYYVSQKNVFPLGSFYIDYLVSEQKNTHKTIVDLKKKYSKIIAMSCQDAMDELWTPFFKEITEKDNENAYILMPRHKTKEYYKQFNFPDNVFFIEDLNTYEIISQSDIHTTINSTTAIESISLGTPNILMNINNLAKDYLFHTLKEYTYYAENPDEFIDIVKELANFERKDVAATNKQNIVPNFKENIDKILNEIEK